jgi:hypothetical protein
MDFAIGSIGDSLILKSGLPKVWAERKIKGEQVLRFLVSNLDPLAEIGDLKIADGFCSRRISFAGRV